MRTALLTTAALALIVLPAMGAEVGSKATGGEPITYSKHIAKLLQENCQQCHQPKGVAPFSLTDYRQARGWGKMIKEVVLDGRMPPWHADPAVGHFSNDRSLSAEQKEMLASWVDAGMPRGNAADEPAPLEWTNDWRIGEPDMVFEMPEDAVIEPTGVVPYQYFVVPTGFTEDKWVNMAECLPGNPKVVHHIIVFIRNSKAESVGRDEDGGGFFDAFAPGTIPMILEPGLARKIPAGSDIVFQMHYTPTGKTETDRSKFGLNFYDGPVYSELMTNAASVHELSIPPNDPNFRVEASMTFERDAIIRELAPHMHYRGKSFAYTLVYADGKELPILNVPKYDFNWQTTYKLAEPIEAPKGSKLVCVAYFDNSKDNPANPDPNKTVHWGDQTWEEMMIGFFHMAWKDKTSDKPLNEVQTD